jgi:hypothetical protein
MAGAATSASVAAIGHAKRLIDLIENPFLQKRLQARTGSTPILYKGFRKNICIGANVDWEPPIP